MQFRQKAIVRALQRAGGCLSARALESACGVRPAQRAMFAEYLTALVRRGLLEWRHGYCLPRRAPAPPRAHGKQEQPPAAPDEGTLIVSADGLPHLDTMPPTPLNPRLLHGILPGDRVRLDADGKPQLAHRATTTATGVTRAVRRRIHVEVDGAHPSTRIHLERRSPQPDPGLVVKIRITRWPGMRTQRPHRERAFWGMVDEVLGPEHDPSTRVHRALARAGLQAQLPADALDAARLIPRSRAADLEGRVDLRDLAYHADPEGQYLVSASDGHVRVSFADVAHFVRPGSPIDEAAAARGTAIAPHVPLLPERLARDLVRLDVGAQRLAITVDMRLAPDGSILSRRIYESVVRGDAGAPEPLPLPATTLLERANEAVASWLREHDVPSLYHANGGWTSHAQATTAFHQPLTRYGSVVVHQSLKAAFSGAPAPRSAESLHTLAARLDLLEWQAARVDR